MTIPREGRVATLWQLTWCEPGAPKPSAKAAVSCVVYHGAHGMGLRVESAAGTILTEPFEMQPRTMSRTKALRDSLKRRGWKEA